MGGGSYNLTWSAVITWDTTSTPDPMLRGFSPSLGGWRSFTPVAQPDPHTVTCTYPFALADVTKALQLDTPAHIATLLPWIFATPLTPITPTPPGPARLFKVTAAGGGHYDLHYTQPVAMNTPAMTEPNLRAYFAGVPQWTSLSTFAQISATVIRFSNALGSNSLSKFLVGGPMQILTSINGFTAAAPLNPIH